MTTLENLQWHQRFNEHMGCTKGCLDYLGVDISFAWLYGGTGNAFVLNMNDTVFVDAAQAWDISMLFDLAPKLGYSVEQLSIPHKVALEMPDDVFLEKQREAFNFVRARVDQGLPCYAWELNPIPAYFVINGYNDAGYTYSGWGGGGECPWDKLGAFDVKQIAVNCVHPADPRTDGEAVRAMLTVVGDRIERPDGWSIGPKYRTGLPAYEMWAKALELGNANRDGSAYITQVWLEAREMAVAFLDEALERLPSGCLASLRSAHGHYAVVRDRLHALAELHPEQSEGRDWATRVISPAGAQLVRKAADAEARGVGALKKVLASLT